MANNENINEIAINVVENEGIINHNIMENNNQIRKNYRKICRNISLIIYAYIFVHFCIHLIKTLFSNKMVFYNSFEYLEYIPSIKVTLDNFCGGFALENPYTYDPFIDENIYYPKAYFRTAIRDGDKWKLTIKELELERCNINKCGQFYRSLYKQRNLNNLYCFKEIYETFIGHFAYDYFSMIFIELFPCKNSTENNNHCKPIEIIDLYLKGTFIIMEFQDIELIPHNYSYPTRARIQDLYFPIGNKLFKEIHIFYQITKIVTDSGILGIDILKGLNNDTYLKYHSTKEMIYILEDDIYKTGEAFCNITIKLDDLVRIQRREYKYKLFY